LLTCLAIVEQTLNSRPLTCRTEDPKELQVLTPQSFLVENVAIPQEKLTESTKLGARWKIVQEVLKQTWNRFLREFIPKLNVIPKWSKSRRPIKEGDFVLVMRHDTPRY